MTTAAVEAAIDPAPARRIVREMSPVRATDLIPLLQKIQDAYGYLPPPVLTDVSRQTGIPTSRMHGVITFYSQFYLTPRGRHTIRACRGTACHVRGGRNVIAAVEKVLGISDGQTTGDMMFSFETVACLGACALSPVAVIDGKYYGKATPRRIEQIVQRMKAEAPAAEGAR